MTTTERGPHTDSGQPTSDSGILRALEGAQPCDGVTHRKTSRSAGNGKATVTLTTPAADKAITGGGRPAEHRGRPQGVEVRVPGIGDHSTFSALGRPKYKELVDRRVWIGQVADEFTVYIPDRRRSGNKRALLAAPKSLRVDRTPASHHVHGDRCRATPRAPERPRQQSRYGNFQRRRTSVGRVIRPDLDGCGIFCQNPGPTLFACSTFGAVVIVPSW